MLRGNVDHGLAVGDQAPGDVLAHAVAALERPYPVGVLAAGGQHGLITVAVGAEPALPENPRTLVDDLNGRGPLMRIHPDDDLGHPCPILRSDDECRHQQ
jgi:hypothetical protein